MTDVLVLCYHAVSPTWPADLSVTPDAMREQLSTLVSRGFRGTGFSDAVTAPPHPRTLAITFDDAYRSVLDLAKPILDELGLVGTVFTVTAFADDPRPMSWAGVDHWAATPHAPEMTPLTWDQLGDLAGAGWEVGSHTVNHPHLTGLDPETLDRELRDSRTAVEVALGRPCRSIAYPYGDRNQAVCAAAAAAGYETAASLHALRPRPHDWPRVGVWHADDHRRFRVKVFRPMRLLRTVARR